MWPCYFSSLFLLVILTASAIRDLEDVNPSVNPETGPILDQAMETDEILGVPLQASEGAEEGIAHPWEKAPSQLS